MSGSSEAIRRAILSAILGLGAVLAGCSPPSGNHTIGATLSADGQGIRVVFAPCSGQRVTSVELVSTKDAVIGDDKDPVLWRIEAPAGVESRAFDVGTTPPGFTERVHLRTVPPLTQSLGVLLDSSLGQSAVGFTVRQLRTDAVFSDGRTLSPQAFLEQAKSECGST